MKRESGFFTQSAYTEFKELLIPDHLHLAQDGLEAVLQVDFPTNLGWENQEKTISKMGWKIIIASYLQIYHTRRAEAWSPSYMKTRVSKSQPRGQMQPLPRLYLALSQPMLH